MGVTWYEALAFTRWLTEHWRKQGLLPDRWQVRLPSEAEWEKAVRGGLQITNHKSQISAVEWNLRGIELARNPLPRRRYPWGDEPDPNRANYGDTQIGATSAVGCFPGGASPYGCEDMSGNVWKWTRSLWGKDWNKSEFSYPYKPTDGREDIQARPGVLRVWRGGAFYDNVNFVRCAFRDGYSPGSRHDIVGFRVVLSPL